MTIQRDNILNNEKKETSRTWLAPDMWYQAKLRYISKPKVVGETATGNTREQKEISGEGYNRKY